jgi:23S rRNA (guanosine2251-2'-O)-methyltransferase
MRRPTNSFEDDEKPHDRTRTVRYDSQPTGEAEEGAFEEEYIYGRNSVLAFMSGDKAPINKLYINKEADSDRRLERIRELARDNKVPVVDADKRKLDTMVGGKDKHQGVVAQLSPQEFLELSEFLDQFDAEKAAIEEAGGNLSGYTIAVLDGIEDPHNVGAIVRSAEASGVKAILLPQRRSAGLTQTVARVSAGALAHMRVVRIVNIVSTLEKLKERGLWIAGLSLEGATDLHQTDLVRPLALVIGSEGTGISRLVAEHCDMLIKIPMLGYVQSLNASVAAGVVFYEVVRQNALTGKQREVTAQT